MLADVIEMWDGREVSAIDVYRDVFRLGEGFIQKKDEPAGSYKANPIGYWTKTPLRKRSGSFRRLISL